MLAKPFESIGIVQPSQNLAGFNQLPTRTTADGMVRADDGVSGLQGKNEEYVTMPRPARRRSATADRLGGAREDAADRRMRIAARASRAATNVAAMSLRVAAQGTTPALRGGR